MRRSFLFMLFFFSVSLRLSAQMQTGSEQTVVSQAVSKFFDGIAALDTKMMRQFTTKDFLLLEDGAVWNLDSLTNRLSPLKTVSFSRINHLDFIRTDISGRIAWVAYHNTADMSVNGQKMNVEWLETAVLVKEGNEWKIQLLHSTRLKPKSP